MASSSPASCYFVVKATIPSADVTVKITSHRNTSVTYETSMKLPIPTGTVLQKRPTNEYKIVQTLRTGDGSRIQLLSVKDLPEEYLGNLKPINANTYVKEIGTVGGLVGEIYGQIMQEGRTKDTEVTEDLNKEVVKDLVGKINAIIHKWDDKPASGSCVVAGGRRRRHKKSRRTRSSRKRRQTRSK
jgi:hypothetical protein